jgi:hypothetical protein
MNVAVPLEEKNSMEEAPVVNTDDQMGVDKEWEENKGINWAEVTDENVAVALEENIMEEALLSILMTG